MKPITEEEQAKVDKVNLRFYYREPDSFQDLLICLSTIMTIYHIYMHRSHDLKGKSWEFSTLLTFLIGQSLTSYSKESKLWDSIATCVCPMGSNVSVKNVDLNTLKGDCKSKLATILEIILAFCIGFDSIEISKIHLAYCPGFPDTSILALIRDLAAVEQELLRVLKSGQTEHAGLTISDPRFVSAFAVNHALNKGFEAEGLEHI